MSFTGSVTYCFAPGAKCLLLDDRFILVLILWALMFHRLLGLAVFPLVRTGQQLLLHRLLRERASRHDHAVPVLTLTRLLVELLHVSSRHTRCHRHRCLAQVLFRRWYAHVSHRLPNDLPNCLEERVTEFRCAAEVKSIAVYTISGKKILCTDFIHYRLYINESKRRWTNSFNRKTKHSLNIYLQLVMRITENYGISKI